MMTRTDLVVEYYTDIFGMWHWRIRSHGREILAASGVSYANKEDCLHAVRMIKMKISSARIENIAGLSPPPPPANSQD